MASAEFKESLRHIRREKKFVTVLFADLKGSLEIIRGSDPERAADMLDDVLSSMRSAVHRFGGMVNRIQGDGIMALFGAPVACENHTIRACYAALEMLHQEPVLQGIEPDLNRIELRIGIHSGEVITRPVVSDSGVHYGVTGETVHVAARMEQIAQPGSAYISGDAYELTAGGVEVEALGPLEIKGLPTPLAVYRLVSSLPGSFHPYAQAGPMLPFAGRGKELRALKQAQIRAESGNGSAVLLTGAPGVGKSRLIQEFADRFLSPDWLQIRCRGLQFQALGHSVVRELVSQAVGVPPGASRSEQVRLLHARFPEIFAESEATYESTLMSLLSPSNADPDWDALQPKERRERIIAALIGTLSIISRNRPIILLIEDTHWLDEASASYLYSLLDHVGNLRLLVIGTTRTDNSPAFSSKVNPAITLRLAPLSNTDFSLLIKALFCSTEPIATIRQHLNKMTGRNPLHLQQCLYALLQDAIIEAQRSGYALKQSLARVKVPQHIRTLLASRIDRLGEFEKDILQGASVLGENISAVLLAEALGTPIADLSRALAKLQAKGFLVRERESLNDSYTFAHGLMRETTYESLPRSARVSLHARFLTVLEKLENRNEEVMAEHAFRGEIWERAADYCLKAGNRAFQLDFKVEAIRLFRLGLEAAAQIGPEALRSRITLDLRLGIRNPLFQLGRIDELQHELDEAITDTMKATEPERVGKWLTYRSHLLWFGGDPNEALQAARSAWELGVSTRDLALQVRARFQEGLVFLTQDRADDCAAAMCDVLHYAKDAPFGRYGINSSLFVTAQSYLARASADKGHFKRAEAVLRLAREAARELREPFAHIFVLVGLGYVALRQGRAQRAATSLRKACSICGSADAPLMYPVAASYLAMALMKDGAFAEALTIAESAVSAAERTGFKAHQPLRLAILSDVLWHVGRQKESAEQANAAASLAYRQGEPASERYARTVQERCEHQYRSPQDSECHSNHRRWRKAKISPSELAESGLTNLIVRVNGSLRIHYQG